MLKWLVRLIGGWIPIGTKPVSEWLGKIIWAAGIVIVINFVTSFFMKTPANNNRPVTVVLPFAKVERLDQSNKQKNEEQKRKWWQPIPYISVAGEARHTSVGIEAGGKIESGLRWDF